MISVVTGANRGLGFVVSQMLLKAGNHVIVTCRNRDSGMEAVRELNSEGYTKVDFHELDVRSDESIRVFADYIAHKFSRIDILCNNAGVYLNPWDQKTFSDAMATNLFGPIKLTNALLPMMKKTRYGRIVNVTSGLAQRSNLPPFYKEFVEREDLTTEDLLNVPFRADDAIKSTHVPSYRISKACLDRFSINLAQELKRDGFSDILVNSANPGWCRTDMGGDNAPRSPQQGAKSIFFCTQIAAGGASGRIFTDGVVSTLY